MIHGDPIIARIRESRPLSATLKRLILQPADGGLLPPAAPGAHVTLRLKGADRAWNNAYSLVSEPGRRDRYEIIVRRVTPSRGGSAHIHDALAPGDPVHLSAPINLFPPAASARRHLLIGGGIGLTPLLSFPPLLRALGAPFELHQICSAAERGAFEALLSPHGPGVHVHAGRRAIDLPGILARQPLGAHVYVCGPPSLMEAVADAAAAAGWPASSVHQESFAAGSGAPFTAVLARSGRRIPVAGDQSLLEALEAAGVDAPSLCRGGACGECMVGVLDGAPDHRDHYLSARERASGALIMTCVSRARTPALVLDL
jgi:ferredoxin-NADP reductase